MNVFNTTDNHNLGYGNPGGVDQTKNGQIYEKITSGIEVLDRIWGGFYKGRSYLVVGPQGSGKTILGGQFLIAGLRRGERCGFVTEQRVEDLILQIESFGFNIKEHIDEGRLLLLKFPLSLSPDNVAKTTDNLLDYLESERVVRLVLDSLQPLALSDRESFKRLIEEIVYRLEEAKITTLMTTREPANLATLRLTRIIEEQVTGVIRLSYNLQENVWRISFQAKWGFPTKSFCYDYRIAPVQGIVIGAEREEEKAKETPDLLLPLNSFLNLIAKELTAPATMRSPFSILGLKLPFFSVRSVEAVVLCLTENQPATVYGNNILIYLTKTTKDEAKAFGEDLAAKLKTILPAGSFNMVVASFPEDGEELEDLLSRVT